MTLSKQSFEQLTGPCSNCYMDFKSLKALTIICEASFYAKICKSVVQDCLNFTI